MVDSEEQHLQDGKFRMGKSEPECFDGLGFEVADSFLGEAELFGNGFVPHAFEMQPKDRLHVCRQFGDLGIDVLKNPDGDLLFGQVGLLIRAGGRQKQSVLLAMTLLVAQIIQAGAAGDGKQKGVEFSQRGEVAMFLPNLQEGVRCNVFGGLLVDDETPGKMEYKQVP